MIFDEIRHHHRHETETPMSRLSSIAAAITELDSNPLISTLAEHGLGKLLQPGEIQTVLSFVAGLEAVRQPQRAPQQVPADGTTQPPA